MDLITRALLEGFSAGAIDRANQSIADSYRGLRILIVNKLGEDSDMANAITRLEQDPSSQAWRALLADEVVKSGARHDAEILSAAERVLAQISNNTGYHTGSVDPQAGNVHMGYRQQIEQQPTFIAGNVHTVYRQQIEPGISSDASNQNIGSRDIDISANQREQGVDSNSTPRKRPWWQFWRK
jgi:hypothetical protein